MPEESMFDKANREEARTFPMEEDREFVIANFSIKFYAPTGLGDDKGYTAYNDAQRIAAKMVLRMQEYWQANFPQPGFHVELSE